MLIAIDATGAVVGQAGLLRVDVGDPVSENTTISLSSSNSSVATVPGSATIETGSSTVQVSFNGVAPGTATLSASLNGVAYSTIVNVVPSLQLSSVYGPNNTLQVGAAGSVYAYLNISVPQTVTINLNSSDAAVVNVPASVMIPPFYSSGFASITAASAGSTVITATLNSDSRTTVINTTTTPLLSSFYVPSRIQVGTDSSISIYLDSIVAGDTPVSLVSSNVAAIDLPATATVPAGQYYVTVPYSAAAVGTTTLTATLNGSSLVILVEVVTSPAISYLYGLSNRVLFGAPLTMSIALDAAVAADTPIALSSSKAAVATAPAEVTVLAGDSSASFPVTAIATGSTIITAALGSSSAAFALTIAGTIVPSYLNVPQHVITGGSFELDVSLNAPAITDTFVTLTSSNPAVVNVPATIIVPTGSSSAQLTTLSAISPGTTVISASLNGVTLSSAVSVVTTPSITSLSINSRMQTGAIAALSVYTDVAALSDSTINLNSSNPAAIALPATISLPAGQTFVSVPVTAGAPGEAFLTATLGGSGNSTGTTVVATPVIAYVGSSGLKYQPGAFGNVSMSFDAVAAADATVTIANSAPSVITIASSAPLPRGNTYANLPFLAVAPGLANVTVSAFGSTRTVTIEVTATPKISYLYGSNPFVGGASLLNIGLDTVVAADTVITLSQDNPAALNLPPTAVVGANTSSASVTIIGLANAATNVTATLGASTQTTTITPVVP